MRGRPGHHRGRAVRFDPHAAELLAAEAGDLDVRRHADAEQLLLAGLDPTGLLGAQRVHVGQPQRLIQRRLVVADVVGRPGQGLVGERVLRDQVAPPDLLRSEPELDRPQVHQPLEHRRRFRPAGAPEGTVRRRVGHRRDGGVLHLRDLVRALGHDVARSDDQGAAEAGVGAAVADVAGPEPGDPAVPGESQLGELHRGPAVHREHRLAARLGPRHRAPQRPGRGHDGTVGGSRSRPSRRRRRRRAVRPPAAAASPDRCTWPGGHASGAGAGSRRTP